jgi:carbamoyl-phosphate synthase large subunit
LETLTKILVLGSGGIKIAEAAEFDYSGSQALKALREEGIRSLLVNPNIATVQTSKKIADEVFFVPLTSQSVAGLIELARPDGVMLGFGGQTALSLGVNLNDSGIFSKYGIRILGTPIEGIKAALSREDFRRLMLNVGERVPDSVAVRSIEEAAEAAERIGLPAMVRVSFNLGGRGSAVIRSASEVEGVLRRALAQSGTGEALFEKYLDGWKEIEYEIMRDKRGNKVAVACLENLDPMGVHTGDSVVIAPSQTLSNDEYQSMRNSSLNVADSIGLIGECNVQTALNPLGKDYYVIETNPRMSRSSALASKATGYPLAYLAAKLALGYDLFEVKNAVTRKTSAFFEPSLDYVALKIPRWDLQKFGFAKPQLGTEMQSVGEVLAIGRNFEEVLQKAVRMLDLPNYTCLGDYTLGDAEKDDLLEALRDRKPYWFIYAALCFAAGVSEEEVHSLTGVNLFFLRKIRGLVDLRIALEKSGYSDRLLVEAKKFGFSDSQLAKIWGVDEDCIRKKRKELGLRQVTKCIDTLAGEWPAQTSYSYLTFNGLENDVSVNTGPNLLVLGAGVFRIGVSVEFDWGVVGVAKAAKRLGSYQRVFILNNNPETVSTDWDVADTLVLDELSVESILEICSEHRISEVIAFSSGQIGNNLALGLEACGLRLVGTSASSIAAAESRDRFSALLDKLGIRQPEWKRASSLEESIAFATRVGYPVLVRPSFVLSGSSMNMAESEVQLAHYLRTAASTSPRHPVLVSKFITGAVEGEIDGVGSGRGFVGAILEHLDAAGIHSGDATVVTPPVFLEAYREELADITQRIVEELNIHGPFNLQFLVKDGCVYVIELNLRLSRSMPFTSKAYNVDLAELSVKAALGGLELDGPNWLKPVGVAVKTPQFSWAQIKTAYPCLGPEMRSTGEVAHISENLEKALLHSWLSAQPNRLPRRGESVLIYGDPSNGELRTCYFKMRDKGYDLVTLEQAEVGGAKLLSTKEALYKIRSGTVGLVLTEGVRPSLDYEIRRASADKNVPLVLSPRLALFLADAFPNANQTGSPNFPFGDAKALKTSSTNV